MQWRWTEAREETGGVLTAECSGTWPDTAEIEKK